MTNTIKWTAVDEAMFLLDSTLNSVNWIWMCTVTDLGFKRWVCPCQVGCAWWPATIRRSRGAVTARAVGRGPSGSADGASVQPAAVAERRFGLRECLVGPRGMGFVLVWAGLMNSYDTSSSI
jgi:hypothetical protein